MDEGTLWPGCVPPSAEDVMTCDENIDEMSADELFALAERAGLLVLEESTTPELLRTRLRRAAC